MMTPQNISKETVKKANELFKNWSFKYVRNLDRHPFAVVAFGETMDGKFCRGISICGKEIQFTCVEGLNRAIGRMVSAFERQHSYNYICSGERCFEFLDFYADNFCHDFELYGYDVTLTENEAYRIDKSVTVKA